MDESAERISWLRAIGFGNKTVTPRLIQGIPADRGMEAEPQTLFLRRSKQMVLLLSTTST